jgi:hypothetical protein
VGMLVYIHKKIATNPWDECLKQLRLAEVASQNALDACREYTDAMNKARINMGELRYTLMGGMN